MFVAQTPDARPEVAGDDDVRVSRRLGTDGGAGFPAAGFPVSGSPAGLDAGSVLASVADMLGRVGHDRSRLAPGERLELVGAARRVADMAQSLLCALVEESEKAQAALRATGTPSASWLASTANMSRKEASGLLRRAEAVAGRPQVRRAALAGRISPAQAQAIHKTLQQLPATLSGAQQAKAEQVMLGLARSAPAAELERAADQVLAVVAPADAAELAAVRLQRQAEAARRNRRLWFSDDARGSMLFGGQLPIVEGQLFMAAVTAHLEAARRNAAELADPLAPETSPEQRRADALIAMVHAHTQAKAAPGVGGGRPRITVTINQADLKQDLLAAGRLPDGQHLSAGELRRLACDADILPAVLGGPSEILDVGRANRLVTPAIRHALTLRDSGCAFPACDTPAICCEAHHITPWAAGGPTALDNLVLLCHHHHGLIEPAKHGLRDQWDVRIGADKMPEFIPPARMDPARKPKRHRRFDQDPDPPPT